MKYMLDKLKALRNVKSPGRLRLFTILVHLGKNLFYLLVVSIGLPWSQAFLWRGRQLLGRLYACIESDHYEIDAANQIYARLVKCLERADDIAGDSSEAVMCLGYAALKTGRTREWLATQYQVIERQEKRASVAGADRYNLRIIDSEVVHSTVGFSINLDAWVKAGILGLRPAWRSVVLVENGLRSRAANQCLLEYWRDYIDFVEDERELRHLRPMRNSLLVPLSHYIPCNVQPLPYTNTAAVWIQEKWARLGRRPLLALREEHKSRGWERLARMGVPRDAWFVTIHVRESGFKGKETFRDSDINTYLSGMRQITDRGGWVIRLGDSSMRPLPSMPNVLDYARSAEKCDWMDVFLCAEASFMIGTSSGPSTISYSFGVPIAMTNNLPVASTYLGAQDLFLPRLMRHRASGKLLTFREMMSLPYSLGVSDGMYRNILCVETIPNNAEEIRDLVSEMLDKRDATLQYAQDDESAQEQFRAVALESKMMIGLPGLKPQARIGRQFLALHKNLLS